MFSLGVCLYFMIFSKFPYTKIEKRENDPCNWYNYSIDLSILDQIKQEKKKDPSSITQLSVSRIDFIFGLL